MPKKATPAKPKGKRKQTPGQMQKGRARKYSSKGYK
jgi:hypothetical protein